MGPCWARVRCPTRRQRQGADVGRDCSEPKLATRASTESSLPVARTLPADGILGAVKGTAALTSKPILVHCAAHTPRSDRVQPAARQRSSRLQHAPSAAGLGTGGTRLQHSARGCNTVCCAAAPRLCRAEADVPEGSSGDTDVGGGLIRLRCRCGPPGMDSFAVQRWAAGDRLDPGADVGGGWTWSRCRCGRV